MKIADDVIALLFVLIVPVAGARPDPCTSHFVDRNWRRSTQHQLASALSSLSDYFMRAGWYRFNSTAGGTIPNTCPRPNSCGTTGPIWAEGSLPMRVGSNFERNLTAYGSTSAGCKSFEWSIYARKCNENGETFYIYDLKSPTDRQLSYCAAKSMPTTPETTQQTQQPWKTKENSNGNLVAMVCSSVVGGVVLIALVVIDFAR